MGRSVGGVLGLVLVASLAGFATARAEEPPPLGQIVTVVGAVEIGRHGVWQQGTAQMKLFEGQTIRTGEASSAEILFDGEMVTILGSKTEVTVADLLLKAQLERARTKIPAPADATQSELKVTPLTGVRGTEKTEEKAGELKREHYWNETAAPAK